jgi:kynurenine formamidase
VWNWLGYLQLTQKSLPLDVPLWPSFSREQVERKIKVLHPGVAYDDIYKLNTQSGTQLDGFRHFAHMPSNTFYNNTKGDDIFGPNANEKCSIHFWAEHGIVGRGVFLDWEYAKSHGKAYDPWEYIAFSNKELAACGKSQGIDIRPASQRGDILPGDILVIRGGWAEAYNSRTPEVRETAGKRRHVLGHEDGQRYAGVGQEEKNVNWLHDCYFSCVGGDMPSFEAWPIHEGKSHLPSVISYGQVYTKKFLPWTVVPMRAVSEY